MVAKSGKTAKAKTVPKKAAKPQAPAKKKAAPATKVAPKQEKTKTSVKSTPSAKAKKPDLKTASKPAVTSASKPTLKKPAKAVKAVKPIEDVHDEVIIPVKPEEILAQTASGKKTAAPEIPSKKAKTAPPAHFDEEDESDFDDDDESDDGEPSGKRTRSKEGSGKKGRARKRSATEEFLVEDMSETVEEDEDVEPILDDLDPFASTLLLDPDLIDAPISSSPQVPPARTKRLAPRVQVCADCGQQFGWLSIERLCFNCLKKKVSQRKKDEDYSGYGTEEASGGEEY